MKIFVKHLMFLIIIACCATPGTQAIPAYPQRVMITTDNDSFYLSLCGDENCKFAITEDGFTALPDSDGWYYAITNQSGLIEKSVHKVCSESSKTEQLKSFLNYQIKGVYPFTTDTNESRIKKTREHNTTSNHKTSIAGNRKVLIVLMQYSDVKFKKSQQDFERLFNEKGYHDDGAYGSVYDYYNKVSYGLLQLQCDVLGPYTASNNMSYYGGNSGLSGNDKNPKALFDEAMRFVIQDVDLSDYDSDGDGYIDNVHIIFAGYGEEAGANSNSIWSHEMTFRTENIGGMMIDRYSCSPELRGNSGTGISRIGAPCHEIGHALGAMDYYDVDYQTGGYYEGTGNWDIMASGSWNDDGARPADFNPYVKAYDFGWVDVQTLKKDTTNIILPSTERNNIYRIDTPVEGDYFLLDNRQSEGINSAEPGKGLLIFHIGPQIAQKALSNTINSTFPQQCYVVCASAKSARPRASSSSYGSISSSGCPYPGTYHNTSFSSTSIPGSFCINGKEAEFAMTNISQNSNGSISFYFSNEDSGGVTPPDDPTEDNDDVQGEIVWSDDFEVINRYMSYSWKIETVNGKGTWLPKTYSTESKDKDPSVLSGSRYMAMESSKSGTIMGNDSRYNCSMTSTDIQLESGEYILKGYYAGYFSKRISNDTIRIEICFGEKDETVCTKSIHITKLLEWDYFVLPITVAEDKPICIKISGSANDKSLLYIDNLKLYKPMVANIKPNYITTKKEEMYIFQLDGKFLGTYDNVKNSLHMGIYILRQGNNVKRVNIQR